MDIEGMDIDISDRSINGFVEELTDEYVIITDRCAYCESEYDANLRIKIIFELDDVDDIQLREYFRTLMKEDKHGNVSVECKLGIDAHVVMKVES